MRLMVDENFLDQDIRNALESERIFNVCNTLDCGFKRGEDDGVLINKGTTKFRRILVTKNHKDITPKLYKPCYHGGVIVFREQILTPEYVIPRMKAFKYLRLDSKAKKHFSIVYDDKIKVITHTETIEIKFDENETTRKTIRKG